MLSPTKEPAEDIKPGACLPISVIKLEGPPAAAIAAFPKPLAIPPIPDRLGPPSLGFLAAAISLESLTFSLTIFSAIPTAAPNPGIVEAAPLPAPKAISLATSLKSAPVPTFANPAPPAPIIAAAAVPTPGNLATTGARACKPIPAP